MREARQLRLLEAEEKRRFGHFINDDSSSDRSGDSPACGGGHALYLQSLRSVSAMASKNAVDEQELARREWLQYHLQVKEWDLAAELAITAKEKADLERLRGSANRGPGPLVTSNQIVIVDTPPPEARPKGGTRDGRGKKEERGTRRDSSGPEDLDASLDDGFIVSDERMPSKESWTSDDLRNSDDSPAGARKNHQVATGLQQRPRGEAASGTGRNAGAAGQEQALPASSSSASSSSPAEQFGVERIGRRVAVWWSGDRKWFEGAVARYDGKRGSAGMHFVEYDDGDGKWHDLAHEQGHQQLRWLDAVQKMAAPPPPKSRPFEHQVDARGGAAAPPAKSDAKRKRLSLSVVRRDTTTKRR